MSSLDAPETDSSSLSETDTRLVNIGLDGEMSGADIEDGCRLIQIGAGAWTDQEGGDLSVFSSLIGYPKNSWTTQSWQERAEQVHGITRETLADAPTAAQVDDQFAEWLLDNGAVEGRRVIIPVGFNVVAFDLPFVRATLPRSSRLLSRRGLDLNAVLFTFAGWDPNPAATGTQLRDFHAWKRSMRVAANKQLLSSVLYASQDAAAGQLEHDAGFDAAQALRGWWWLREQITSTTNRVAALQATLDDVDPLRRDLGEGTLRRLLEAGATRDELTALVASVRTYAPEVKLSKWFGTSTGLLGGRRPVQVLASDGWPALKDALGI